MISYYNIIAAKLAKINLDGQIIHERRSEIHFAPNKEAKEFSEGVPNQLFWDRFPWRYTAHSCHDHA
jgi:hypothetical protein